MKREELSRCVARHTRWKVVPMTESPDFTCSVYKINPASSTRQHLLAASTMYSTHWLRQYQVPARTMSESFPWLHPVCHILSPLLAPPPRGRAQHEHYTRIRGPRGVGELGTHDCKSAEKTVLQSNKRVCRKQARALINTSEKDQADQTTSTCRRPGEVK